MAPEMARARAVVVGAVAAEAMAMVTEIAVVAAKPVVAGVAARAAGVAMGGETVVYLVTMVEVKMGVRGAAVGVEVMKAVHVVAEETAGQMAGMDVMEVLAAMAPDSKR